MSMQEPTDDQLDGLFRKSAEEFNSPFDPAAWQAMKGRLDTHDRLTIWEHLLRWGLPMLLLLVLTGGSWNAHRQQVTTGPKTGLKAAVRQSASTNKNLLPDRPVLQSQLSRNDAQPLPVKTVSASIKRMSPPETTANRLGDDEKLATEPTVAETARRISKGKRPANSHQNHRPAPIETTNRVSRLNKLAALTGSTRLSEVIRPSSSTISAPAIETGVQPRSAKAGRERSRRLALKRTENRITATFPVTTYAIAPAQSFTEQQVLPDDNTGTSANKLRPGGGSLPVGDAPSVRKLDRVGADAPEQPVVMSSFVELTNRPGRWPKPFSFTNREVIVPEITAETERPASVQPVPYQKGLSVRFVVSPDLSAIGLRNFQRPGTNVGLLVEYRLASRWSIQTGVMQSTKVYKARTTDYELPAYVAKWYVKPQSVNGRCTILDIPINLRYDVVLRPRLNGLTPSRWFVSGGVTTYIMQQEDYVYDYADKDKPYVKPNMREWSGKTGRYNFSQLNLSAGYERALSRRLSWQVEPFVKIPLKGVGYYRINLLSTGAFFSLRYKL